VAKANENNTMKKILVLIISTIESGFEVELGSELEIK
jgi:hypothetical protein